MAAKVKVVIRHDDDDDDGGRSDSQIYKFLSMDTKRETTTVLARNNGSGAC